MEAGGGFSFGFGKEAAAEEEEEAKGAAGAQRPIQMYGRRFDDESDDDTALDVSDARKKRRKPDGRYVHDLILSNHIVTPSRPRGPCLIQLHSNHIVTRCVCCV